MCILFDSTLLNAGLEWKACTGPPYPWLLGEVRKAASTGDGGTDVEQEEMFQEGRSGGWLKPGRRMGPMEQAFTVSYLPS